MLRGNRNPPELVAPFIGSQGTFDRVADLEAPYAIRDGLAEIVGDLGAFRGAPRAECAPVVGAARCEWSSILGDTHPADALQLLPRNDALPKPESTTEINGSSFSHIKAVAGGIHVRDGHIPTLPDEGTVILSNGCPIDQDEQEQGDRKKTFHDSSPCED